MDSSIEVVVAARPGLMREALVAFLAAMPAVRVKYVSDDAPMLLDLLQQDPPHAIIMDVNLGQDTVLALLPRLHATSMPVRCIVLTNDVWQHGAFLSAGADAVLVKGFLDESLRQAVLGDSASAT
jgi:DNA-binding NarL/FixJ family response regulator